MGSTTPEPVETRLCRWSPATVTILISSGSLRTTAYKRRGGTLARLAGTHTPSPARRLKMAQPLRSSPATQTILISSGMDLTNKFIPLGGTRVKSAGTRTRLRERRWEISDSVPSIPSGPSLLRSLHCYDRRNVRQCRGADGDSQAVEKGLHARCGGSRIVPPLMRAFSYTGVIAVRTGVVPLHTLQSPGAAAPGERRHRHPTSCSECRVSPNSTPEWLTWTPRRSLPLVSHRPRFGRTNTHGKPGQRALTLRDSRCTT